MARRLSDLCRFSQTALMSYNSQPKNIPQKPATFVRLYLWHILPAIIHIWPFLIFTTSHKHVEHETLSSDHQFIALSYSSYLMASIKVPIFRYVVIIYIYRCCFTEFIYSFYDQPVNLPSPSEPYFSTHRCQHYMRCNFQGQI